MVTSTKKPKAPAIEMCAYCGHPNTGHAKKNVSMSYPNGWGQCITDIELLGGYRKPCPCRAIHRIKSFV